MKKLLSSNEAAQLLGVSLATLYSYVSRGLLQSISESNVKNRRYEQEDVLRLAARRRDGKKAGHFAEQAIDWGNPILESKITFIENGTIRYRGYDLITLASQHTLEQTAAILWDVRESIFFDSKNIDIVPDTWFALNATYANLLPLERALIMLPAITPCLASTPYLASSNVFATGALLMRVLAAALLKGDIDASPLHEKICRAWKLDKKSESIIRIALIMCADHELNISTFTVRCVASTGASLPIALSAGLAALSGPLHGGEVLRVRSFIDDLLGEKDMEIALAQRNLKGEKLSGFSKGLPGFGHPLYPNGDPRGKLLIAMASEHLRNSADTARILDLVEIVETRTGQKPNLDFGLAAIERILNLPPGASQALFALGRSAGWIAHYAEQIDDGHLIRPRARYVGTFDFSSQC